MQVLTKNSSVNNSVSSQSAKGNGLNSPAADRQANKLSGADGHKAGSGTDAGISMADNGGSSNGKPCAANSVKVSLKNDNAKTYIDKPENKSKDTMDTRNIVDKVINGNNSGAIADAITEKETGGAKAQSGAIAGAITDKATGGNSGAPADASTEKVISGGIGDGAIVQSGTAAMDNAQVLQHLRDNPQVFTNLLDEYLHSGGSFLGSSNLNYVKSINAQDMAQMYGALKENPHFNTVLAADDAVKSQIISGYLHSLSGAVAPKTIPVAQSSAFAMSAPARPKSIKEAGDLARKMLKSY